jgi:RNA polymerase sigma factor (sigma-70 family)
MSPLVSIGLLLTQSDSRLVELTRAGHERAFEALVERYRRALLVYCRRQLLSHERAEDALQQGLLQAWLALRGGAEVRHVKPWLYSIVHNTALNVRRCGYSYVQLSETLRGADAPAEDLDRRIAVREALAGLAALPEMQREALLRTAIDGSSYQEAAAVLGCSEGAVRGLVHRARLALRTALTAVTPPPLLSWMLGSGGGDAPLGGRIAEVGAGGGSAGVTAGLLKLAATAATAGVMVGGIGILRHPHAARARHSPHATAVAPAPGEDPPVQTGAVRVFIRGDVRYRDRAAGGSSENAHDRSERSVGGSSRRSRASHRHITLATTLQPARILPQPVAPTARGEAVAVQPDVEYGTSSAGGGAGYLGHGAYSGGMLGGAVVATENGPDRLGADGTAGRETRTPTGSYGYRQASDATRNTSVFGSGSKGSANGEGVQSERQNDASPSGGQELESQGGFGNGAHHEGSADAGAGSSDAGEAGRESGSTKSSTGGEQASEEHESSPAGGYR